MLAPESEAPPTLPRPSTRGGYLAAPAAWPRVIDAVLAEIADRDRPWGGIAELEDGAWRRTAGEIDRLRGTAAHLRALADAARAADLEAAEPRPARSERRAAARAADTAHQALADAYDTAEPAATALIAAARAALDDPSWRRGAPDHQPEHDTNRKAVPSWH